MILAGILLGIGGVFLYKSTMDKIEQSEEVTAEIVEIETIHKSGSKGKTKTEHKVYVDFEYDGEEYEHYKLGYYTSSMDEGEDVEIYVYEKSNGDIQVLTKGGSIVLLIVSSVFAVALAGIGTGIIVVNAKIDKKNEDDI